MVKAISGHFSSPSHRNRTTMDLYLRLTTFFKIDKYMIKLISLKSINSSSINSSIVIIHIVAWLGFFLIGLE